MSLILTGFLLVAFVSPSFTAVKAVQTFVESTWSNEIYYVSSLSGEYGRKNGYDDVDISITAVDEYTLYVNGVEIGSDNDWKTVEKYTVSVNNDVIHIGVKVINHGNGDGNGLVVDVDTGSADQLGTSTRIRHSELIDEEYQNVPIAWWTFDPKAKEELDFGDDWYVFDETMFTKTSITKFMKRAMDGEMGDVDYNFSQGVEVITGYLHTNVDIGYSAGGGIALRRIEGENIALDKDSEAPDNRLTDGDLQGAYEYISNPLGDTKYVDLGRIYRVNKMTLFTGKEAARSHLKSVRGYAVEISLDKFRWEEVGVIHGIGEPDKYGNVNIGGYDNYSVAFPPEWARYLRYNITEVRIDMPAIGQMMVFAEGHILEGEYESPWIDFGEPTRPKNFDQVKWEGIIRDGTEITIQTQTVSSEADTSEWSTPTRLQSFSFDSPEPATHFRYRVNLATQVGTLTPTFKKLSVTYSYDDQPVTYADGYILGPIGGTVAMGADSTFVYALSYNLVAGQNIKSVAISVPVRATLNSVYMPVSDKTLDVTYESTIDTLYVTLKDPLTVAGIDTLHISFNTMLYKSSHTFEAFIYNATMNDGAGGIRVWENKELGSNTVTADKYLKKILMYVKAVPKVLTPNGDNKNDFTVFEFTLAKVETNVMIKIFNTDGSIVFFKEEYCVPGKYSAEKSAAGKSEAVNLPGHWDGKDEDGELVPPGIYIYQVIADTDEGGVFEGGTVVVAY